MEDLLDVFPDCQVRGCVDGGDAVDGIMGLLVLWGQGVREDELFNLERGVEHVC